jgi:hypothetical protein
MSSNLTAIIEITSTDGQTIPSCLSNDIVFATIANTQNFRFGNLNSNEYMVINSNIGIGISNPTKKLHVVGDGQFTSNLTVGGNLILSGATTLSSNLNVIGTTSLSNILNVTGATALSNNLNVIGATSLSNNLSVIGATTLSNNLNVIGATSLSNILNVTGATILSNNLSVIGATALSNNLNVIGATSLSNILNVTGATALSNNLSVIGNIGIGTSIGNEKIHIYSSNAKIRLQDTITSNNTTTIDFYNSSNLNGYIGYLGTSNLRIVNTISNGSIKLSTGNNDRVIVDSFGNIGIGTMSPSNKLHVIGDGQFTSNLISLGNLSISGITTLSSNLGVSGITTLSSNLGVSGITMLSSNLGVSGITTLSSNLGVSGITTLSSNLGVSGITMLSSNLGVSGITTLSSNLGVSGITTLSSNLGVSGITTLNSTLGVSGITTLNSTLGVTGITTLNSDLNVQGNTYVYGILALNPLIKPGGCGITFINGLDTKYAMYLANAGPSNSISKNTAISYGNVTSAIRSRYWNVPNTGFIWEGTDGNSINDIGLMALEANTGNLTLKGTITASNLISGTGITNILNPVSIIGTLQVTSPVSLSNNLTIFGVSTFNSNISITGNNTLKTSTGLTALGGSLQVSGITSLSNNFITSGNVGIGTTNPQSALHVYGAVNTAPPVAGVHIGFSLGATNRPAIELCASDTNGDVIIDFTVINIDSYGRISYNFVNNYMSLSTTNTLGASITERLRISNNGLYIAPSSRIMFDNSPTSYGIPGSVNGTKLVLFSGNGNASTFSTAPTSSDYSLGVGISSDLWLNIPTGAKHSFTVAGTEAVSIQYGGIVINNPGQLNFGSSTRQMVNLYGTIYGIGIQGNTLYNRTANQYQWYQGGIHSDTQDSAGFGGISLMKLDSSGNLNVNNNLYLNNTGAVLSAPTCQFGSINTSGGTRNSYAGYVVNNTLALMDNGTDKGVYVMNDAWIIYKSSSAATTIIPAANLNANNLTCTSLNTQGYQLNCGSISCTSINTNGNGITCGGINAGGSGINCGAIQFANNATFNCTVGNIQSTTIATYRPSVNTNVVIDNSGYIGKAGSSIRFKINVEDIEDSESENILDNLRPVKYQSNPLTTGRGLDSEDAEDYKNIYYGFIAEEVDLVDKRLVHYCYSNDVLIPDGLSYDRIPVLLLKETKKLKTRVINLEADVLLLKTENILLKTENDLLKSKIDYLYNYLNINNN